MKTNEKRAIVEVDNKGIITVYSMKPILKSIKEFRDEQLNKIGDDRFYTAMASRNTDKTYEFYQINEKNLRASDDDSFTPSKLGFSTQINHNPAFEDKTHILIPTVSDAIAWKNSSSTLLRGYVGDKINGTPFRIVDSDHNQTQYFLPISEQYQYLGFSKYATMDVLHLTGLAYLEQLLRCNRVNLFLSRANELGVDISTILNLYSFEEAERFDLDKLKEAEKKVGTASQLLYGDTSFIKEDPLDEVKSEQLRRPVSDDLLEQAEIDKPILEKAKSLLHIR